MPIVLPAFTNKYLLQLTACSRVLTKERDLLRLLANETVMISSVGKGKSKLFVRFATGEGEHLHVDVAKPASFEAESIPKPTHSWEAVQKIWTRFLNQKIKLRGEGCYSIPLTELPESGLVKAVSVESKSGNVGMRLTAGTLTLSGAPIQKLKWSLKDVSKIANVELEVRREQLLSELYLQDVQKTVDSAFKVFVKP